MSNLHSIDPLQSKAIQFISLQHELGMAIGLNLHLKPMLRHFIKVCLHRLGLIGINCAILSNEEYTASWNGPPDRRTQLNLSIPEQLNQYTQSSYAHFPSHFFNNQSNLIIRYDSVHKQYNYHFNLAELGFISLHKVNAALDDHILELLKPIFLRLSISCQASLEHAQLLDAIEAKEKAEKVITHQLFHDELTGLANRRMLMKCLIKDIVHTRDNYLLGAILYLDLDRFKSVNDSLGHSVGDQLLKSVSNKLSELVRERDLVTRLSGDEFAILLTNIRERHQDAQKNIEPILNKIKAAFSIPLSVGEHTLHITPSIGIETYSNLHTTANRVLRNADTAMYLAKSHGVNNAIFYDKEMSLELEQRLDIEKELQHAVNDLSQFELYYQPQYCSKGICVGAEALIRWHHLNSSITCPSVFIPIAEETGMMLKLGRWILIEACKHLYELELTGVPQHFSKLSVNVSAVQFNQSNFVHELLTIVKQEGITPSLLTIELTESTLIESVHDTVTKMMELKTYGIGISIDDFGTGYSSLAYLNQYPIAALKIDQVFVKNLHLDSSNRAIVNAMLGLGQSLNIAVIAEGVETQEELNCLKSMNCQHYQGYYFCRPRTFEHLQEQLSS